MRRNANAIRATRFSHRLNLTTHQQSEQRSKTEMALHKSLQKINARSTKN